MIEYIVYTTAGYYLMEFLGDMQEDGWHLAVPVLVFLT